MSFPCHSYLSKKEIIVKHLTAALVLGLAGLFIAPYPAVAQSPETIASEVVDRETLQAFVEGAKAQLESITDPNDISPFITSLGTEGDFKHGNTYLILLYPHGTVYFHAGDAYAQGINLLDMEDDRGNNVVHALIEAANAGGGFVEYYWDDPAQEGDEDTPKIAYITNFADGIIEHPIALIGGYHQAIAPIPQVTAADVVGRETLKAFVQGTLESYLTAMEQIGLEQLLQHQEIFRKEGGPWRQGSIYFFLFSTDGYVLFHGVDRSLEFNKSDLDKTDVNGVKYLRELIRVSKAGGGFVEYYWDDPTVIGDEDTSSPKVSYAELFTFRDQEYVIGAGFYTGSASTAVEGRSWGQLKSRF